MVTLQYVYALTLASELMEAFGRNEEGVRYREQADKIRSAVRDRSWDSDRRLFNDVQGTSVFSQQTNTMAILVDALPENEQRDLMERVLADTTLTQSTYYYSYYVFEAVRKVGLADRYIELLAPWKGMLAIGLTTTPENPEPTRSDSHAWAAHPNYGLLATVLGVRPSTPGFQSVHIEPSLGLLNHAEGRIPHPSGDIEVSLTRRNGQGIQANITLPPGLSGTFVWQGHTVQLREGSQEIVL